MDEPKGGPRKKKILIVDDDAQILETLEEFLKPFRHTHQFEILTAQSGEAAIGTIETMPIDLLITDLQMPRISGYKIISFLTAVSPTVPIIVITGFGSLAAQAELDNLELLHYVEKPIEFNSFITQVLELLSEEKKGKIEGIATSTLLQLLEMEKTTCTLEITAEDKKGSLFLKDGVLQDAATGALHGKDAALEILNWEKVRMDMKKHYDVSTPTIHLPLTEILLESSRLRDERKANREEDEEMESHPPKLSFFKENNFGLELENIESLVGEPNEPAAANSRASGTMGATIQAAKEIRMDIPKLLKAIDILKDNLGGALMATDIYGSEDAQSVAGWNSNPVACAVFGQFTNQVNKSLKDSGLPELGRYYLLDLVDKKVIITIPLGEFQWSMLIDGSKIQLGLVLNLALPKAISAFEEAMAG